MKKLGVVLAVVMALVLSASYCSAEVTIRVNNTQKGIFGVLNFAAGTNVTRTAGSQAANIDLTSTGVTSTIVTGTVQNAPLYNCTLGATTPATAVVTTLNSTGAVGLAGNTLVTGTFGVVGATTVTGAFNETGACGLAGNTTIGGFTSMAGLIKATSNQTAGIATLVTGNVTVNSTAVNNVTSEIYATERVKSGTQGSLSIGAIINATSFVITSSSAADNSTVSWLVVN